MEHTDSLPLTNLPGCLATFRVTKKLIAMANCYLHAREHVVFSSFKQLYFALRVLEDVIGKPAADIKDGRVHKPPTQHFEYVALIEMRYPGLLNFDAVLTDPHHVDDLFDVLTIDGLGEETMLIVKNVLCAFNANKLQKNLKEVYLSRRAQADTDLLVDPWCVSTTFTDSANPTRYFPCTEFTRFPLPEVNAEQICTLEEFRVRFNVFTRGIFDANFPWEETWIAGGICKLLYCKPEQIASSDVDIFVNAEDSAVLISRIQNILDWFEAKMDKYGKAVFLTIGSVVNISFAELPCTFQVIGSIKRPLLAVLANFDTTNSMWACFGCPLQVRANPSAVLTMRTRVAEFSRISTKQAERSVKSLRYGYHVSLASMVEVGVHFEDLLEARETLCAEIDGSSHRSDSAEQVALWTTKYPTGNVANNVTEVMGKLEIQNINRSYTKQSFEEFDVETLAVRPFPRNFRGTLPVKTKNNVTLKLTAYKVNVQSVDDANYTVSLAEPENWAKFAEGVMLTLDSGFKLDPVFVVSSCRCFNPAGGKTSSRFVRVGTVCDVTFTMCIDRNRKVKLNAEVIQIIRNVPACAKDGLSSSSSSHEDAFD